MVCWLVQIVPWDIAECGFEDEANSVSPTCLVRRPADMMGRHDTASPLRCNVIPQVRTTGEYLSIFFMINKYLMWDNISLDDLSLLNTRHFLVA